MINHVRTLLLNSDGSKVYPTTYPGEEYVDPSYRPLVWPAQLQTVRTYLFGPNPDRAMVNYRLRQLLGLIHACELDEFVTDLDQRITYWPVDPSNVFAPPTFGTAVTNLVGQDALYVQGLINLVALSRLLYQWQVVVRFDGTVAVARLTDPGGSITYPYTMTNGLSQQFLLTGTSQTFVFAGGAGDQWLVQSVARPIYSLPTVVAGLDQGMTDDVHAALFGGATADEPYKTFGNLWSYHKSLPYRLGGLVLALAYRCDALRQGVVQ